MIFFLYFIDKTINQITVKIICRLINNKTIVSCGPTSYLVLSRLIQTLFTEKLNNELKLNIKPAGALDPGDDSSL